jgi:Transglycosylase-like domain
VALSQRVLQEADLVHERTVQYQVEVARANLVGEELAGNEGAARALRLRAAQTESLLRQEALLSYADAVPEVGAGGQSSSDLVEVTDQTTYLALTVGDIAGTLRLLEAQQSQLAGRVAASRRELQSALEAESSAGEARKLALGEAASLQALLSKAESQVAALTAAERPPTGPPVGDGIVKAVTQQLGAAPTTGLPMGTGGQSDHRAKAAVAPAAGSAHAVVPARATAAFTKRRGTRATTTLDLATTSAPGTTMTRQAATGTSRPSTTTAGTSTTTTTTTKGAGAPTPGSATSSTTTSSTAATASSTTSSTSSSTTAPPTTTTTDPPPPTTAPPTTAPPTTAPPTTVTTTPPAPTADEHPAPAGGVWLELRDCESGDNYQADTGNGYYGAYQFSWPTWVDLGYPGRPDQEPYWMQDQAAQRLEGMDGWSQWPSCSAALGV